MKTMAFLALIVVLAFTAVVSAATPTVTLGITTSGNTWQLYGLGGPDCPNLLDFDVSFGGGGLGQVMSSTIKIPGDAWQNAHANPNGAIVGGVLSGLGNYNENVGIGTPVLLAQGTFTGPAAFSAASVAGNVVDSAPGYMGQGATWVFQSAGSFPFPSGAGPSLFYNNSDANLDGKVDFKDYIALEGNFGKTYATRAMGDANGDQTVNFVDYVQLELQFGASGVSCPVNPSTPFNYETPGLAEWIMIERNFGRTVSVGTGGDYSNDGRVDFKDLIMMESVLGPGPTPEPATMALLLPAGLTLLRRRR